MTSQTIHRESEEWHETYHSPQAVAGRRAAIAKKLALLGVDRFPRESAILDLCCGNGETLDALFNLGFRDLEGRDVFIPDATLGDSRFNLKIGDACDTGLPSQSKDWVLVVHAMHHMQSAEVVERLLEEAFRVLKPGGRLSVVDFPNSPQIQAAFWFFRQKPLLVTPYLRYFGKLIEEEWPFLQHYLPQFKQVWQMLTRGRFEIESEHRRLFYFFLTLRKPAGAPAAR